MHVTIELGDRERAAAAWLAVFVGILVFGFAALGGGPAWLKWVPALVVVGLFGYAAWWWIDRGYQRLRQ
ncbi:MAG: hypothetical protein ACOCR6_02800 [archaeon]